MLNLSFFSPETRAYVLNFHGRVTRASVKNFQLVHSADGTLKFYIYVLQMYNYKVHVYTCMWLEKFDWLTTMYMYMHVCRLK